MKTKEKIEKQILWISFISALLFAISEVILAVSTNSQSVLMDGVYDTIELVLIIGTLFLTPLFYKNVDEKRPFGYGQIESLYVVIKGIMMIAVSLGMCLSTIKLMLNGGNHVEINVILIAEIIYGFMNLFTLIILKRLSKSISSLSVDIQIKGWEVDVLYSFGMALAFFIASLLRGTFLSPILPYFDQIIAVLVILFTLPNLIKTVYKAIRNMFLFAPGSNIINTIKKRTEKVITKYPYQTTFYDITKVGRRLWISVYFKPLETQIVTMDLKNATEEIKKELNEEYKDFYVELIAEVWYNIFGDSMKNGFTLVELLAVIMLLAIVSLVAIPAVGKMLSRSRERALDGVKDELINVTKEYTADNLDLLPSIDGEYICVDIDTLKNSSYISNDEVIDPTTKKELEGFIKVTYLSKYSNYKYEYLESCG